MKNSFIIEQIEVFESSSASLSSFSNIFFSIFFQLCNISLPMPQCWNRRACIWRRQYYERALLLLHHESGLPLYLHYFVIFTLNQHFVHSPMISIAESRTNFWMHKLISRVLSFLTPTLFSTEMNKVELKTKESRVSPAAIEPRPKLLSYLLRGRCRNHR